MVDMRIRNLSRCQFGCSVSDKITQKVERVVYWRECRFHPSLLLSLCWKCHWSKYWTQTASDGCAKSVIQKVRHMDALCERVWHWTVKCLECIVINTRKLLCRPFTMINNHFLGLLNKSFFLATDSRIIRCRNMHVIAMFIILTSIKKERCWICWLSRPLRQSHKQCPVYDSVKLHSQNWGWSVGAVWGTPCRQRNSWRWCRHCSRSGPSSPDWQASRTGRSRSACAELSPSCPQGWCPGAWWPSLFPGSCVWTSLWHISVIKEDDREREDKNEH